MFHVQKRETRVSRDIIPLWREKRETQVFIDKDYQRGKEAYEAFCQLAEQAVAILAASGVFKPIDAPPASGPDNPFPADARNNHYAKEWMTFVHRFAAEAARRVPAGDAGPQRRELPP